VDFWDDVIFGALAFIYQDNITRRLATMETVREEWKFLVALSK
jgi:hypothetical protein